MEKRTFSVVFDEDGNIVSVEPPTGTKLQTGDLKSSPLANVTSIVVPMEFLRAGRMCCVHTRDCRYFCWPC